MQGISYASFVTRPLPKRPHSLVRFAKFIAPYFQLINIEQNEHAKHNRSYLGINWTLFVVRRTRERSTRTKSLGPIWLLSLVYEVIRFPPDFSGARIGSGRTRCDRYSRLFRQNHFPIDFNKLIKSSKPKLAITDAEWYVNLPRKTPRHVYYWHSAARAL